MGIWRTNFQYMDECTQHIPSDKRLHNHEKSPYLTCQSTISMAKFTTKLLVYHYITLWQTNSLLLNIAI
jgi:hypothetical protein